MINKNKNKKYLKWKNFRQKLYDGKLRVSSVGTNVAWNNFMTVVNRRRWFLKNFGKNKIWQKYIKHEWEREREREREGREKRMVVGRDETRSEAVFLRGYAFQFSSSASQQSLVLTLGHSQSEMQHNQQKHSGKQQSRSPRLRAKTHYPQIESTDSAPSASRQCTYNGGFSRGILDCKTPRLVWYKGGGGGGGARIKSWNDEDLTVAHCCFLSWCTNSLMAQPRRFARAYREANFILYRRSFKLRRMRSDDDKEWRNRREGRRRVTGVAHFRERPAKRIRNLMWNVRIRNEEETRMKNLSVILYIFGEYYGNYDVVVKTWYLKAFNG